MEWLGLGAGRRELKELKKATIDKRIFIKIRVCMREGKGKLSIFKKFWTTSLFILHQAHSLALWFVYLGFCFVS